MFTSEDAAALYDVLNPWDPRRPDDGFFHRLVMASEAVLDLGCGTGAMLRHARDTGHRGRLVGLDPNPAMLARARRHDDVTWVAGSADQADWDAEFDLATMAGHAFQCLVTDVELRASLSAIHASLRSGGEFAFSTRHPQARAWEGWTPDNVSEVTDAAGRRLRTWHEVTAVVGDVVTFTATVAAPDGAFRYVQHARLRFLDEPTLTGFLTEAGFTLDTVHGDWDGSPVGPGSGELVVVARRA